MKTPRAAFRKKLAMALLIASLAMALYTGLISYHLANSEFWQLSLSLSEGSARMATAVLSNYQSNVEESTVEILSSPALRTLAEEPVAAEDLNLQYESEILTFFRAGVANAARGDVNFHKVDIYLVNGYKYSTGNALQFSDYYDCLDKLSEQGLETKANYIRPQWGHILPLNETRTVPAFVRFVYSATAQKIGVALFMLNNKDFSSVYSSFDTAYITNATGHIISSKNNLEIGKRLENPELLKAMTENPLGTAVKYRDDSGMEVVSVFCPWGDGNLYLVVQYKEYGAVVNTRLSGYISSVLLMAFGGVLFSLVIATLLSKGLSQSVLSLTGFLKNVGSDYRPEHRYCPKSHDEIAIIGEKVNEMLDRLSAAAKTSENDLKAKQMLEITLLRSQINPHLLYNTLNSALWCLERSDNSDAMMLISRLSEYFKLSLSGGRELITLKQELSLIECYIDIQRLARHKDTRLELSIPDELFAHPLQKLSLQPIVENAILHGFDGYRNDGVIEISASHDDNCLRLTVRDNGIGILPDELQTLIAGMNTYPPLPDQHSFGLYNINRSIKQKYGGEYGLSIDSEISEYTCVTMTMPYLQPDILEETHYD